MDRNEGLVRRVRNRGGGDTAEGNSSLTGNNSIEENDSNRDQDEDLDDIDSKETRLTLMEEVLLLGLKDKEVSAARFLEYLRELY